MRLQGRAPAADGFVIGDSTKVTLPKNGTTFFGKKARSVTASPCHNTDVSVHSQLIEQF